MASAQWIPELFGNALAGVSSAVSPDLLPPNQIAWGINIANRGSKPGSRPSFTRLMTLPSGLVQGASYFSVQNGMGILSVEGSIYRLRINERSASYEQIEIDRNSGVLKQVWMQQTVETIVIQDGQSDPILYNGSTARRADPEKSEVPRGRQMAYGNGRLWVAVGGKNLRAGDIRSSIAGSELFFTEAQYLSGGGDLYFPRGITGLAFIATTGTSDYGALMLFGLDYADSIRADITFRDLWASTPGFVTNVLRHTGCASHWSLASVNQDLYWRDASGGLRSIRSALADESSAGNSPISREVARLTDYDSPQLLPFCSSINFNNRLLVTSSPRLNAEHGVTWQDLIALDFAPVSTMQGKTQPAYDGQWHGLNFTHMFQGQFNGRSRAFAVTHDAEGSNSLWEINTDGRSSTSDTTVACSSGTGIPEAAPVTSVIEFGRRTFGFPGFRKRLERLDVFMFELSGDLSMKAYWRADNNQKWLLWDEGLEVCAKVTDTPTPGAKHVWKNLLPQQRPQIKTYTIPSAIDGITHYSLQNGFDFQIRLVWTGRCKIDKAVLYASRLADTNYSIRELLDETCFLNDVSGNQVGLDVAAVNACPFLTITDPDDQTVELPEPEIFEQFDGPIPFPVNAFRLGARSFTTQFVSGENRVFWDNMMHPMTSDHASGEIPVHQTDVGYPKGVIKSTFNGHSIYNIETDSYTGPGLTATIEESGIFVLDALRVFAGAGMMLNQPSFSALLAQMGFFHVAPVARTTREFIDGEEGGSILLFSETPLSEQHGVFVGPAGMNFIWVDGYSIEALFSGLITAAGLGIPVARTGDPARTQFITSYNSSTNTYTGNMSRVKKTVAIPTGKTKLIGDYEWLVTPSNGSAAYTLYETKEFEVTPGENYEAIKDFPWIVDASVFFVRADYSFNPSVYLGFSAFGERADYMLLPGVSTFPGGVQFVSPVSNSDAWDDFQNFGNGAVVTPSGNLETLATGYAWADGYLFCSLDRLSASDDFELYADGVFDYFGYGRGWDGPGAFVDTNFVFASDDFESYPVGMITSLDVAGDYWYEAGTFF